MNERVAFILSAVRAKLGEIGTNKIQNTDIYYNATIVVNDMLQDMKCKEVIKEIYTVANKADYLFKNLTVKEIYNDWDGQDIVYEQNWKATQNLTGDYPLYYHLFSGKIHFAPAPASTNNKITVWAFQEKEINRMDDDTEPETPESLDEVLILGIAAQFNPDFMPEYERKKDLKGSKFHIKKTASQTIESTW